MDFLRINNQVKETLEAPAEYLHQSANLML